MKQTVIDVQFERTCDYNVLIKRIEKLKAVKYLSGASYREYPSWRKVTIVHDDTMDDSKWDTWLYETEIKGLEGYGTCETENTYSR